MLVRSCSKQLSAMLHFLSTLSLFTLRLFFLLDRFTTGPVDDLSRSARDVLSLEDCARLAHRLPAGIQAQGMRRRPMQAWVCDPRALGWWHRGVIASQDSFPTRRRRTMCSTCTLTCARFFNSSHVRNFTCEELLR